MRVRSDGSGGWPRAALVLITVPLYAVGLASDRHAHGDEGYWTAAAWRATELVAARDASAPFWQTGAGRHVLTPVQPKSAAAGRNPKLGLLLLGAPMHLLGVPPPEWREYVYARPPEWNRRQGRLPDRATLLAARLPVAALGVLAALWFFAVLRSLLSPGWAFAGALLLAVNPLIHLVCRRAMLDGPAYAMSCGAVLAAIAAARDAERWRPALLAGLAISAAASCKLNAGLLAPVLAAALAIEASLRRSVAPLLGLAGAGAVALVAFVAANPTLYPAPLAGLLEMLRLGAELQALAGLFPADALATLPERAEAAYQMLMGTYGPLASTLGLPLDPAALLLGVGWLGWGARVPGPGGAAARVLLLWLVAGLAAAALWPPVRWERYYVPGLAPVAAAECVGVALTLSALARRLPRARRPAP